MGNVLTPPEQRVVLEDVSWQTYEHLLSDHLDKSVPRFTFDREGWRLCALLRNTKSTSRR